ncbi:MAG: TonB-dependent receptor, partial [Proteobacteria bacterium]|nr:TonB-dependent receptor [Pseudomonadota bacterium]NIS68313.1 TonB-dependent receptor [Pseudomonadota bacterium]
INFKATVGDVTGFVEFALITTDASLRHAYASWDMGGGSSLLFGHTWSIMAFGFTDMRLNGDLANIGFGTLYFGRVPQLRYTYAGEAFTVQVALEANRVPDESDLEDFEFGDLDPGDYLEETTIPGIYASVSFQPLEMLSLTPSGFFQMVEATAIPGGTKDLDFDAFGLALDGRLDFDIARISFEGWWGQNLGGVANAIDVRPGYATGVFGQPGPKVDAAGNITDVEDANSYGGFVQLTFRFEPAILNLGAGYQQADIEVSPSVATLEDDVATSAYFINVLYNLTDNFYVQPEVAYFDYGDDADKNAFGTGNNDLGSDLFVGVHFQADF